MSSLLPEQLGLATILLLLAAAALAGWVDAVVGGGGLIQLPAMLVLLPGAAPAQILATNKLASICGTATSSVAYYRRVRPDLRTAVPTALCALGGAAGGAACASLLPKELFRPLVLVLLVGVAVMVLRNPAMGHDTKLRFSRHRHAIAAGATGAAIGFYDGIFGPGTGTFLVFVFVALLGYAFLEASAQAKITNFATNLGALLVFIPAGAPIWGLGLGMGAANVAGAYLGARTAVARGGTFVRAVFLFVVTALVLRLGYDVVADGWPAG